MSPHAPLRSDEFLILAVLSDGENHGNGIMQGVYRKTNGGLMLRSAGLYGVLRRLTNRNLIEQVKRPHEDPEKEGMRTYYKITSLGLQVVASEAQSRAMGR